MAELSKAGIDVTPSVSLSPSLLTYLFDRDREQQLIPPIIPECFLSLSCSLGSVFICNPATFSTQNLQNMLSAIKNPNENEAGEKKKDE